MEMEGIKIRLDRQRELTWFGAWLPHLTDGGDLDRFMGKPAGKARIDALNAAFDKMDRALARH